MIKDLAFCAYSVEDVPKAIAFYRDLLGLEPGDIFSEHWAEFNVGSTAFGIGNGTPLGFIPGKSNGVSFEVDDIAAMRQKLLDHGTKVSDLHDFPNCQACFVTDPEGNVFGMHQHKA